MVKDLLKHLDTCLYQAYIEARMRLNRTCFPRQKRFGNDVLCSASCLLKMQQHPLKSFSALHAASTGLGDFDALCGAGSVQMLQKDGWIKDSIELMNLCVEHADSDLATKVTAVLTFWNRLLPSVWFYSVSTCAEIICYVQNIVSSACVCRLALSAEACEMLVRTVTMQVLQFCRTQYRCENSDICGAIMNHQVALFKSSHSRDNVKQVNESAAAIFLEEGCTLSCSSHYPQSFALLWRLAPTEASATRKLICQRLSSYEHMDTSEICPGIILLLRLKNASSSAAACDILSKKVCCLWQRKAPCAPVVLAITKLHFASAGK